MSSTKTIDKLTPSQEAMIPKYLDKFLKIGLSTEPCNRQAAEDAVADAYTYLKMPRPTFQWTDSPFSGAKIAAQLLHGRQDVTEDEIREQLASASYGSFEAYWVSFYSFIANELPVQSDGLVKIVERIVENCGVFWTFEPHVVMSEKPEEIHMADKKLHNPDGLALKYRDGEGIFMLDGVKYTSMMQMALGKMAAIEDKTKEEKK